MYQLNPNLKTFWKTRKPYKRLKGGRFSSKTQDAGGMAAFLARNYSLKFLCIRQFQNRITDSVYTVIKNKIEEAGWTDEFDIGVSTIKHKKTGSEFLFYGIARNIDDIKGTEGIDVCWIEEAEGLTEEQWSVIDPTIRKEGSEVWILYNPRFMTDFVESKLPKLLGNDLLTRHINYDENPFLSDTARKKAERMREVDVETYNHIYLGHPKSTSAKAIIKMHWVQAAIDAHKKIKGLESGGNYLGFDIADAGEDKCATVGREGSIARKCNQWKGGEDELLKSCTIAYNEAVKNVSKIHYDSIGVGATAGAKFSEINEARRLDQGYRKISYEKFNAGGAVVRPDSYYSAEDQITNKDKFANIKAQAWWMVADRFRNTYDYLENGNTNYSPDELISIDSEIDNLDELIKELCTPLKDVDNNGRDKVESKKDLEKRGIASPNLADAFIMSFAPVESSNLTSLFI